MALVKIPIEVDITCVNRTWFTFKKLHRTDQYVIGFFQRAIGDKPPTCIIDVLEQNNPQSIVLAVEKRIQPDSEYSLTREKSQGLLYLKPLCCFTAFVLNSSPSLEEEFKGNNDFIKTKFICGENVVFVV